MTKKIFALVMVVSILGAFLAGCNKDNASDSGSSASAAAGGDAKTTS